MTFTQDFLRSWCLIWMKGLLCCVRPFCLNCRGVPRVVIVIIVIKKAIWCPFKKVLCCILRLQQCSSDFLIVQTGGNYYWEELTDKHILRRSQLVFVKGNEDLQIFQTTLKTGNMKIKACMALSGHQRVIIIIVMSLKMIVLGSKAVKIGGDGR